jgi:hypothetical protein
MVKATQLTSIALWLRNSYGDTLALPQVPMPHRLEKFALTPTLTRRRYSRSASWASLPHYLHALPRSPAFSLFVTTLTTLWKIFLAPINYGNGCISYVFKPGLGTIPHILVLRKLRRPPRPPNFQATFSPNLYTAQHHGHPQLQRKHPHPYRVDRPFDL